MLSEVSLRTMQWRIWGLQGRSKSRCGPYAFSLFCRSKVWCQHLANVEMPLILFFRYNILKHARRRLGGPLPWLWLERQKRGPYTPSGKLFVPAAFRARGPALHHLEVTARFTISTLFMSLSKAGVSCPPHRPKTSHWI